MHGKVHRLGVVAIVLALVTLVGVAYAQTATTSSTTSSTATSTWTSSAVTGTVTAVDPQAKTVTIQTEAGSSQTFLLSDPIGMRVAELKVGDRVRIEPTPGAGADTPTQTASRLEVLGSGTQRTVSTERPVLGEAPDAGEDSAAMPSSAGTTTGRPASTDRPVLGQKPNRETATTGSASAYGSTAGSTATSGTPPSSTYGSSTTTSPSTSTSGTSSSTSRAASSSTSADKLPATASPLPMVGILGLLALAVGLAVRATRKQLS